MSKEMVAASAQAGAAFVQGVGTAVSPFAPVTGTIITLGGMTLEQFFAYWFTKDAQAEKAWIEKRIESVEMAAVNLGSFQERVPRLVRQHVAKMLTETNDKKRAARRAFLMGRVRAVAAGHHFDDIEAELEVWLDTATPLDIHLLLTLQPMTAAERARRDNGDNWQDNVQHPTLGTLAQDLATDQRSLKRSFERLGTAGLWDATERELSEAENVQLGFPPEAAGASGEMHYALTSMGEHAVELLKDFKKELEELQQAEKEKPQQ